MGKLGKAPSRFDGVAVAGQRLGQVFRDRFEQRQVLEPWRRWYKLSRWASEPHGLRWQILLRDNFTCQMCGLLETDTSQLVADHKVPHRGDEAMFWDEGNIWCLCVQCHSRVKQAEERADV